MNVAEIAREYGVVPETVRRKLRKKFKIRRKDGRLDITQRHVDYLREYFESPHRNERVPKRLRRDGA